MLWWQQLIMMIAAGIIADMLLNRIGKIMMYMKLIGTDGFRDFLSKHFTDNNHKI